MNSEIKKGYSAKINDPFITDYVKKSNKWLIYIAISISVFIVIGLGIAGAFYRESKNPEGLFLGLTIGGIAALISLFRLCSIKSRWGWDGVVIEKSCENKQKRPLSKDKNVPYVEYSIIFLDNKEKRRVYTFTDDITRFNYFNIKDNVRYHNRLNTYEKFDKTSDTIIYCNVCNSLNDIHDENCLHCKYPLFK